MILLVFDSAQQREVFNQILNFTPSEYHADYHIVAHHEGNVSFISTVQDAVKGGGEEKSNVQSIMCIFDIKRVIFIGEKSNNLTINVYAPRTSESLRDVLNITLTSEQRAKLDTRVFKKEKYHWQMPTIVEETCWRKKEEKGCVICMSAESTICFIPCSHQCMCCICAQKFLKQFQKCPLCQQWIETICRPIKN